MGVTGDIFQVVMQQSYLGQTCLNAFYYRQTSENTDPDIESAEALAPAFDLNITPAIADLQVDAVQFETLETINLFNPADLNSRNITTVTEGAITAIDALPSYVASEFRTSRVTRAIRRGFKRFTGLDESMMTVGVLAPAYLAAAGALSVALSMNIQRLNEPLTPIFQPVIVKRIKYTTSSGSEAYRLPTSQAELEYFAANFIYTRITTQNSRKSW